MVTACSTPEKGPGPVWSQGRGDSTLPRVSGPAWQNGCRDLVIDVGIAGVFPDAGPVIGDLALAESETYLHTGVGDDLPLPFDLIPGHNSTRTGLYPLDDKVGGACRGVLESQGGRALFSAPFFDRICGYGLSGKGGLTHGKAAVSHGEYGGGGSRPMFVVCTVCPWPRSGPCPMSRGTGTNAFGTSRRPWVP